MPTEPAAGEAGTGQAGARFQRLVEIMRALRGPDGCPWDREQSLESLRPFLLEETYEVLDAIDRGDHAALRGEIGDLLFEAVFLAQICAEAGRFTVEASLDQIARKLVRRHPHVFGADPAADDPAAPDAAPRLRTSDQVLGQWEQIKAREQAAAGTARRVLAGVPATLPALLRAYEIGSRAAAVGFDWAAAADVLDKIDEETAELRETVAAGEGRARIEEEMGDLLFALANLSRKLGVEPESALRRANAKFSDRFDELERRLEAQGRSVHDATLEEMEAEWRRIKHHEGTKTESGPRRHE